VKIELTEVLWLEEHAELTLAQLAELSRLSEADLLELIECGVIVPADPRPAQMRFGAPSIVAARTASRLRRDFELDAHAVALAITLLDRIRDLEAQVQDLLARMPPRLR
jgi:chaperone modulatory protein CbpM